MYKLINISKSFGAKEVLKDINLTLHNEVIALIGENGAGKTTLLKILLSKIKPDNGKVEVPSAAAGYVPQQEDFGTAINQCFDDDTEQWRIDLALQDVGLKKPMDFNTKLLSGGEKTRLAIAIVLAKQPKPNVLLLDEPTNNLDAEGLVWLEKYVKHFKGSVVIISHDRNFINKSASKILDLKSGILKVYSGNYDNYRQQKDLESLHAEEAYEASIEERRRVESALRQRRELELHTHKHIKRTDNDKAQRDYFKNRVTRQYGQQVRSMESRLKQISELDKPENKRSYKIAIDGGAHLHKLVLSVEDVSMEFSKKLFSNLSFEVRGNDRFRINGKNGSGKSTLLKIALGEISPTSGKVTVGENISIGYLSQDVDGIDTSKTALDNLLDSDADITDIYREARALGMGGTDLKKYPSELSRGQQSKLSFAKLLLAKNDLLILDEPTNHLDIPTRENIEQALEKYKGAMLISSHDEFFFKAIGVTQTIKLNNRNK